MSLKEEYAPTSAKTEEKLGKKVISDDTFALCDFMERLTTRIEILALKRSVE